jgi:maleate isomerase
MLLLEDVKHLNTQGADVVIASACVQMPSLAVIQKIEDMLGIPTLSTAVCTVRKMMDELGIVPVVPNAGALLAGH